MLNLKTVFVLAFLSMATSVQADESTIDMTDLYATINAQLIEGMAVMQQDLTEDLNALMHTENKTVQTEVTVLRAE
ncbi:hypothetical protein HWQ46_12840 [Shewanella sp. D64]|uniref:hypothetical protein n=1 Tax=unclassified Shewanella TaxID=196818 RepID=UPI0022BA326D|nr:MULTISPECIES: hypothetical protein [unclassified Shewanella]MEC4726437.1 hypothetical protein [Shewanella sp. D64]MEC4738449.1 hypothetical protein [Shewanella sp. E94]WBJ94149.1 hypothetical protein HWQ47_19945 [Shewanella sp. MTB7]